MAGEFEDQKDLIAGICQRLGLDYRELADAGGINQETMRKYYKGYQRMPAAIAVLLRHIEEQRAKPTPLKDKEEKNPSAAAFEMLETGTLENSLVDLASRLKKTPPNERKYVLSNIQSVIDELSHRDLNPANSLKPSRRAGAKSSSAALAGKIHET